MNFICSSHFYFLSCFILLSFMTSQNDASVGSTSGQHIGKSIFQHSYQQIIEKLEEVFSQNPNPENDVIEQLSEDLGLDATQVKIWFYDKGNDIKAQQILEEKSKIEHLKNKIMYSENFQMCLNLKQQFCAASNNPEQQRAILQDLLNEYAKFGEDVMMISKIIDHFIKDMEGYHDILFSEFESKLDSLGNYKDPKGLDLELRLGCYKDPNGLDLELKLGLKSD
ncbi:homeobox-leucine zipper protein PROTODERMAL FACTOR 2-like [Solanum pennellii]|uniref:Homeobox-leucine zipper protein PROTODERMAL FACTOR 2-like n=1 Tax=Solanum pennellii TaxID=28526 RepID=A0ABM1HMB5_SOLPN|nr:homeobox-leucine zipper protein PROTODERMAL FACTOR 2-like [Solanum pennellii]